MPLTTYHLFTSAKPLFQHFRAYRRYKEMTLRMEAEGQQALLTSYSLENLEKQLQNAHFIN